ncbi:MAG: folylpolyglutamate synthase/dihydrofolate synthase family protein [Bacillota bacterium]
MDYEESVAYLYRLGKFGSRPGLERVARLLARLGSPHQNLNIIHVAGTNGKGSTCCYIAEVLQAAGYRTGLYSSPHLQSVRERIRVNGDMIDRVTFAAMITDLREIVDEQVRLGEEHATYFEILTAAMYAHFARVGVDFVVQETGLGGRFDATNVVPAPLVAVITNIDLDHTEVLGETVAQIAREKAGILKEGSRAVASDSGPESLRVLTGISRNRGVPLAVLREDGTGDTPRFHLCDLHQDGAAFCYCGERWQLEGLNVLMEGKHQVENAALSVAALEQIHLHSGVEVTAEQVRRGLGRARWPGRLEKVMDSPRVLLDGAHNPNGARVLSETLAQLYRGRRIHAVIGMLSDRDPGAMLAQMAPVLNGTVVATRTPVLRGWDVDSLVEAARGQLSPGCEILGREVPAEAVDLCLDRARPEDVVVIWGSLYLVGAVRERWYQLD